MVMMMMIMLTRRKRRKAEMIRDYEIMIIVVSRRDSMRMAVSELRQVLMFLQRSLTMMAEDDNGKRQDL